LIPADVSRRVAGAPQAQKSSPGAARWLAVALIMWLAGALAGFAALPKRQSVRTWTPKPPAHRPVEMESPLHHDYPALA
jgi:hypothetical protein